MSCGTFGHVPKNEDAILNNMQNKIDRGACTASNLHEKKSTRNGAPLLEKDWKHPETGPGQSFVQDM